MARITVEDALLKKVVDANNWQLFKLMSRKQIRSNRL
ncbi:MAG: hypothetical protein ACI9ZT_001343 [Gammaproteobacteria bacterium]|jgi:hypothetical protein